MLRCCQTLISFKQRKGHSFNHSKGLRSCLSPKKLCHYESSCPCDASFEGHTFNRLDDRKRQHVPMIIRSHDIFETTPQFHTKPTITQNSVKGKPKLIIQITKKIWNLSISKQSGRLYVGRLKMSFFHLNSSTKSIGLPAVQYKSS